MQQRECVGLGHRQSGEGLGLALSCCGVLDFSGRCNSLTVATSKAL